MIKKKIVLKIKSRIKLILVLIYPHFFSIHSEYFFHSMMKKEAELLALKVRD